MFTPIGYFDERDIPHFCEMTKGKLEYCEIAGLTIIYIKKS